MTNQQMKDLCERYIAHFSELGYLPHENQNASNSRERIGHALWMCTQIPDIIWRNLVPKANRWLGFVQGVLWTDGGFSIDQMKEDNRGKGATDD